MGRGPSGRDRDLAEEIRTHLEMATREHIERGMSPADAHAAAMREFGNPTLIQQTTREMWSWTTVEQLLQDLRFGARILSQAPAFSFTAIALIALVIGGNTTIRDFGVRMALGASSHLIQRAVVREAFLLTAPGLAIGFLLSALTATAARAVLFGVTAIDPVTYLGVLTLLAVTSVVASCVPAWRAGRVNVVDALRQE